MDEKVNARTHRQIIDGFDHAFGRLYLASRAVITSTDVEILYTAPGPASISSLRSIGESVLRGAAAIEQTFGGITANLWDDPFEWTLPEYLSTPAKVAEHLAEVEETRKRAFRSFVDDGCLIQHVAVPTGATRPLIELLLETLLRAADYHAQAVAALKFLSRNSPRGFII